MVENERRGNSICRLCVLVVWPFCIASLPHGKIALLAKWVMKLEARSQGLSFYELNKYLGAN
jgi:hypothetical protein